MDSQDKLLTVEEVAAFLRVKPTTVYVWAKNGKIPANKIGRLWRFRLDEIKEWLNSGTTQSGVPHRLKKNDQ